MKEQFAKWAEVQKRRRDFAPTRNSTLENLAEEITILETLLANGFHNIPGETRDVRSILENRQQQWRDTQKPN